MDDFTVSQNTGHVEQVGRDSSIAQIEETERRARAQVVEAEVESRKVSAAEEKAGSAKTPGNEEAKVYGDLAVEALAPGLRMLSTVTDFVGTRHADLSNAKDLSAVEQSGLSSGNARTMEQDISSALRAPGLYRVPTGPSVYGGPSVRTETEQSSAAKPVGGEDIMARANIAETSLKEQGKDAIKSWEVKDAKVGGVAEAKQLTFGLRNSNELALQSAQVARQEHSATMYQVQQLAPGLSLGSGPSIRPADLLREARDQSESRSA